MASRPSSALGPRSEAGRETAIEPSNGRSEFNGPRSLSSNEFLATFLIILSTTKGAQRRGWAFKSFSKEASAGTCAAVLPYLCNLGLELVEEVLGCAIDNPIANQELRRALQLELLGKVLGFVERFLNFGVFCVLLEPIDVELKLLGSS